MAPEERQAFLERLVAEEFSSDAVVEAKDVVDEADDEPAYRVFLGDSLVYLIPEGLVDPRHEGDIRRQLRDAKGKFASLLGIPAV